MLCNRANLAQRNPSLRNNRANASVINITQLIKSRFSENMISVRIIPNVTSNC